MLLQAAVQRGLGQMEDGRLQGAKVVVKSQHRMTPECHDHSHSRLGQNIGPLR